MFDTFRDRILVVEGFYADAITPRSLSRKGFRFASPIWQPN